MGINIKITKLKGYNKWKRRVAIFKFTLGRGYIFLQLPALSLVGAGVLAPYFPGLGLWILAIIAFICFIFVGWLDVKFNILQEEQKYMTETNPMLMEGLFGLNKNIKIIEPVIMAQEIIDEVENEQKENN